jgi:hypothetical protein
MGYSARYHAASLAAVFFALAIGILVGSQVGGDVLDNTRKDLESSLTGDLDDARGQIDDLETEISQADNFGTSVFPALTENQLAGMRIGLVGLGSLPDGVSDSVGDALAPTGGKLAAVGVVREPPDTKALSGDLAGTGLARLNRNNGALERYGRTAGRQMISGGRVLAATQSELLSQSSGQFGGLDGLIIYREESDELEGEAAQQSRRLNRSLISGAESTFARVVGVEEVGTDPSSVAYFNDNGLTSIDNLDQPAGKVSLVYALGGAEGSFGVKDGSERLFPELIRQPSGSGNQRKQG